MWSVRSPESPVQVNHTDAIAQCCAFQRLSNIPQGEPHPKEAHYRFVCWVMLFRTLDLSIDKRERLTCPLSSCKQTFQDQQYLDLIHHVSSCSHLDRGVYDCPYCHKEESFCWELPYSGTEANQAVVVAPGPPAVLSRNNSHTPSEQGSLHEELNPNHPEVQVPDHSQLFTNTFVEFDNATFPEVFVSTQVRPGHSPVPDIVSHQKKRKLGGDFGVEGMLGSTFAEFSNDTLPETTDTYSGYNPQYGMTQMTFELPTSNVGRQGSTHLSARTSPEAMQGTSPRLMQQALEMNLNPFHIDPISPGFGESTTRRISQSSGAIQKPRRQSRVNSMSPQRGPRGSVSSTGMLPMHISTQSFDLQNGDPSELIGSQRHRRTSTRSDISPGARSTGGSLPEEAEKSSLQCKECGRVFTGKAAWLPSNLQRHMRETHLNAAKIRCRICNKDFNRGHNLRHHMKAVHGEQP